jgi:fructose-1,6-bisphosphatase/inositol monophosphatase family enzyme
MNYSVNKLKGMLCIAKEASLSAGTFLAKAGKGSRKVNVDSARDVKIGADRQSEDIIRRFLERESSISILTEESGLIRNGSGEGRLRWIVDPLDGTLNFLRGIPISCVSIGLWEGDEPLLGVVYDFNKLELFSGIAGIGAWLNGRRIRVSGIAAKEKAVLLTGFPSRTDFSHRAIAAFVDDVRSYRKVRLLGSAALSLAYVAAGRADAYMEKDIMIWDIAGGIPIVKSAGGGYDMEYSKGGKAVIARASNGHFSLR